MKSRSKLLTCLMLLASSITFAADSWPSRPITMVVPFPPGGLADLVARPVAESMSRSLGQQVVILNKAGAGGGVGMAYAAQAKADGYTMVMALSSLTVIPLADAVRERKPMYNLTDLRPIARFTADPTVLAINAKAPWKTLKDFVADVKNRPGVVNFGSSGNYGTMHVPMEMFAQEAGLKMTHVPYTGAGPSKVALLAGQIDAISTGPATVLQLVKTGKLRVLGHWGNGPLGSFPGLPSLKDSGFNAAYAQWSGLFIPAGTPEPIAQLIREAAKKAAADPKVNSVIQGAGTPLQYLDAPEFEKYVQADYNNMKKVVTKIGKLN